MYIRQVKDNHMFWDVTAGAVPTGEVSVICLLVYCVQARETECYFVKKLTWFWWEKAFNMYQVVSTVDTDSISFHNFHVTGQ